MISKLPKRIFKRQVFKIARFQDVEIALKTCQVSRLQDIFKTSSKFKISKTMNAISRLKIWRFPDFLKDISRFKIQDFLENSSSFKISKTMKALSRFKSSRFQGFKTSRWFLRDVKIQDFKIPVNTLQDSRI